MIKTLRKTVFEVNEIKINGNALIFYYTTGLLEKR